MKIYIALTTLVVALTGNFADAQIQEQDKVFSYTSKSLKKGMKMKSFEATSKTGSRLSLPGAYRGKLVLLDIWHPEGQRVAYYRNLARMHEKYGSLGLVVVHLNLVPGTESETKISGTEGETKILGTDRQTERMAGYRSDTHGWMHVCDSVDNSTWTPMHSDAPQALLIDADTREILATEETLWGNGLERAIEIAMSHKFGPIAAANGAGWSAVRSSF